MRTAALVARHTEVGSSACTTMCCVIWDKLPNLCNGVITVLTPQGTVRMKWSGRGQPREQGLACRERV